MIEQLIAAGAAKDWTIRIVPEKVLPELREAGLTEEQERTMMVDNAIDWLTCLAPRREERFQQRGRLLGEQAALDCRAGG